jgi:hypothetical protein
MGGAAVPLVGMSVAFFIMEMSPLTPNVVRDNVARLGYYMRLMSVLGFAKPSADADPVKDDRREMRVYLIHNSGNSPKSKTQVGSTLQR